MRLFIKAFLLTQLLFTFILANGQTPIADSLFHPDSLRHIVEQLASDSLKGRLTGTPENLRAASFIAEEFRKSGLSFVAGNNKYFQVVKPSWVNVVGAIKGKTAPGQLVIFSAHYDHIGTINSNPDPAIGSAVEEGDSIYNGANDNASGVAAVISLAKYFRQLDSNERTLIFVAFTGEELGLLGSRHLAGQWEPDSIVAVINIEMIGRSESPNPNPYITGYEFSDLMKILNRNYRAYTGESRKEFFKIDPYTKAQLFMRSDNYSFVLKGIPSHSVMLTSPEDKYYHSLNDEPGTLDYEKMKKVILGIAYGVSGLIKGIDTPKRIY